MDRFFAALISIGVVFAGCVSLYAAAQVHDVYREALIVIALSIYARLLHNEKVKS